MSSGFTPESGHCSMQSACLKGAIPGRGGKLIKGSLRSPIAPISRYRYPHGTGRMAVMTKKSEVLRRWQLVSPYLHRKQQTVWAASEAEVIGPSGCLMLANATGISIPTLTKWTYRLKL